MSNSDIESVDDFREKQLKALLEEYKEMRKEICTATSQYFSIFFGIFLTGLLATFNIAFDKNYLFLAIPFLMVGWISIILIMRLNIQHIAKYISRVETDINDILGAKSLEYETRYAKKLWFSNIIKLIGSIPLIILVIIFLISVYNGFFYLDQSLTNIFGICINKLSWFFVILSCSLLFILIPTFVILPEKIFKKKS